MGRMVEVSILLLMILLSNGECSTFLISTVLFLCGATLTFSCCLCVEVEFVLLFGLIELWEKNYSTLG